MVIDIDIHVLLVENAKYSKHLQTGKKPQGRELRWGSTGKDRVKSVSTICDLEGITDKYSFLKSCQPWNVLLTRLFESSFQPGSPQTSDAVLTPEWEYMGGITLNLIFCSSLNICYRMMIQR